MRHLVSYKPASLRMFNDFDKVFDSFFSTNPFGRSANPSVDIREEENRYVLEAELPGFTEKDIDVKVEDMLLTISSKQEKESEESQEGYVLKERKLRSFTRSFVLPKEVDREKIEANVKNGLLTLELQKAPESKPKAIEVKVAK